MKARKKARKKLRKKEIKKPRKMATIKVSKKAWKKAKRRQGCVVLRLVLENLLSEMYFLQATLARYTTMKMLLEHVQW